LDAYSLGRSVSVQHDVADDEETVVVNTTPIANTTLIDCVTVTEIENGHAEIRVDAESREFDLMKNDVTNTPIANTDGGECDLGELCDEIEKNLSNEKQDLGLDLNGSTTQPTDVAAIADNLFEASSEEDRNAAIGLHTKPNPNPNS